MLNLFVAFEKHSLRVMSKTFSGLIDATPPCESYNGYTSSKVLPLWLSSENECDDNRDCDDDSKMQSRVKGYDKPAQQAGLVHGEDRHDGILRSWGKTGHGWESDSGMYGVE